MALPYSLKKSKEENALVLGGLGFIGSNTVHRLVNLDYNVTVFDACLEPYGWNFANIEGIKEKVKFIKSDMRDFDTLRKVVVGQKVIFNCAGQVSHMDSMTNPYLDIELNLIANINLLEACRKFNDTVKIVYCGTRAQIGKAIYSPIDESHPVNPTDIYGIDKLAAEKYHLLYGSVYGMQTCSLILNNTFGPRHQMKHSKYGILNWFIRLAMENKKIKVFGKGEQKREYNYVDDAVDAMILTAQSNKSNEKIYILGSGKPIKFIEMVNEVIRTVGSGSYERVAWPHNRKNIEVGDIAVSFKKIKKELKWEPTTPFREGLKKTVEFYKQNREKYF